MAKDVEFNYTANDRTGSAAASAQRNIRKTGDAVKSESSKIENIFGKGLVQIAESFSPKLAETLTKAFSSAGEAAGPVLIGVVAASLPVLGSLVSAAIIGGAGIGGVVGGVLIASQDARVQGAFAGMKTRIGNQLKDAAIPFISQTIAGIDEIEKSVSGINFKAIFSSASQFVVPLAHAAGQAISSVGEGVTRLIQNARPVIDVISIGITAVGKAIGDVFDELSDNGVEAASALESAFGVVYVTIEAVGAIINALTESYGFLAKFGLFGSAVQQQYYAIDAAQKQAAKSAGTSTGPITSFMDAVKDAGGAAGSAAPKVDDLTQSIDDAASAGQGFYSSTTSVGEAIANLQKSLKDNGKTLDQNTEKGRNNRTALVNLASALTGNYDAYVKLNGAGKGAETVANNNRASFVKLATQLGLSKTAANKLATEMGLIPSTKNVHINTNADDVKDQIKAAQDRINALHGKSIAIAISTNIASVARKVNNTLDRLGGGFDASSSFALAGAGNGVQRTGGPNPVNVTSDVNSYLYLDGALIYTNTARQVRANSKRDAWRQKVGKR